MSKSWLAKLPTPPTVFSNTVAFQKLMSWIFFQNLGL